ncbi:hypothetical protein [Vibrio methylphosphonaticus]|uniref:hypothetical protein n=1 Tax=Vibrio methylphosphonaticus TaxID=2946866 RepID=UPI002029CAE7|nr:hypothetical protein [Vibrio methylphosphonaticus]MCL9773818.1 hypothetical protein [Vibrio methylphosphonaticus]
MELKTALVAVFLTSLSAFVLSDTREPFFCTVGNTSIEVGFGETSNQVAIKIETVTQSEFYVEQSSGSAIFVFDETSFPLNIIEKTGQTWFVEKNCHITKLPQSK